MKIFRTHPLNRIRFKCLSKNQKGFTLLEVMIAMTIMLIAFASVLAVQGNSISTTIKARDLNIVAMLARNAMSQTETEISGKKFSEMKTEESGVFEEPFKDYSWTRKIKEVKFPDIVSALTSAGKEKDKDKDGQTEQAATMAKLVSNYLTKALREIIISIKWKYNGADRTFDVTMYWVDFNSDFQLSL